MEILTENTITAQEASVILGCSRAYIQILQLKGLLKAVPTIHPRWYFDKSEVIQLSKKISSKKVLS